MNAWDLFEALGEVELMPLDTNKAKKIHKVSLRLIMFAAAIALLVGSTVAVGLRAHVHFDEHNVELHGVSLLEEGGKSTHSMTYHTAHISFEMSTVKLSATEKLSRELTAQWLSDPSIKQTYLLDEQGSRCNLGTLAEAEAFLGIELLNDIELERLVRSVFITMVISDGNRAQKEYEEYGRISADGLIVYLSLCRERNTALEPTLVSESGITVYIALTETFLRQECEQHLYSYEKEGPFRKSGLLTHSGKSLLLLENIPEAGFSQTAYAAWCSNGMGYLAHIKTHPDSYATPLSLLTPFLYGIK